jgi:hypothetical protein
VWAEYDGIENVIGSSGSLSCAWLWSRFRRSFILEGTFHVLPRGQIGSLPALLRNSITLGPSAREFRFRRMRSMRSHHSWQLVLENSMVRWYSTSDERNWKTCTKALGIGKVEMSGPRWRIKIVLRAQPWIRPRLLTTWTSCSIWDQITMNLGESMLFCAPSYSTNVHLGWAPVLLRYRYLFWPFIPH